MTTTGSVRLRDGRTLEYDLIGDPSARAVMWVHGAGDSRKGRPPKADVDGAFIVLPNRAGYGKSTPHPGRTILDFADDAVQLADHLGLNRFSPIGWSAGCPHALACGVAHPDRVDAIGVFGGAIPLTTPGWKDALAPGMAMILEASLSDKSVNMNMAASMSAQAREGGDRALEAVFAMDVPAWEFIRSDPEVMAQALDDIGEGTALSPDAFAQDLELICGAWGFDVADVRAPVRLFYGSEDFLCGWGELLVAALPDAKLEVIEGAGHSQIFDRRVWETVIRGVLEA